MSHTPHTMQYFIKRWSGALLAVLATLALSCPAVLAATVPTNWSDLNGSNIGDWSDETNHSVSRINFFNTTSASDNTLIIQNAREGVPPQITGEIYGGYSSNPTSFIEINSTATAIDNNTVIVKAPTPGGTAAITGSVSVYGGFKFNANADKDTTLSISNNTVIIESGVNLGSGTTTVAGAYVPSSSLTNTRLERVTDNRVIIYGGTMSRISGAAVTILASNLSAVDNNSVEINLTGGGALTIANSGSTIGKGTIYGADFHDGSATNNRVRFYADDSSSVSTTTSENINIIGGNSGFHPGEASGNEVAIEISGRTASPAIAFNSITGGSSGDNTRDTETPYGSNQAYRNSVYILGSAAANVHVGEVTGGRAYSGIAADNTVNLTDVTVTATGKVMGGHAVNSLRPSLAAGKADNNSVNILRGTINGTIYGGLDESTLGERASGNRVAITDAAVAGAVYGGYSPKETKQNIVSFRDVTLTGPATNVYGGYSMHGDSTDNTVSLYGVAGSLNHVYGGFAGTGAAGSPAAVRNTVNVYGSANNLANTVLFGGGTNAAGDAVTGNTLNLLQFQGGIKGLKNFANLNIFLPDNLEPGQTIVTITGDEPLALEHPGGPPVQVALIGASFRDLSAIQAGDSIIVVDKVTGTPGAVSTPAGITVRQGLIREYRFEFDAVVDTALRLMVTNATLAANAQGLEQAKALSEGKIAGTALVNQAGDLAAGPGIQNALAVSQDGGLAAFGAISGGDTRYYAGSHVDVRGFSLMTGLAWRTEKDAVIPGSLLAGLFFEAGWGDYDTHNSFASAPSVDGDGDMRYAGGGLLSRYDAPCGAYAEGSFRAGRVKTEFSSDDLRNPSGEKADYDSSVTYYGAHAGLGYVWRVSEDVTMDLSTKYFWTHMDSDTVKVLGDPVKFKSSDSHRWRSGGRVAYAVHERFSPYVGAYYEHEYDGKAKASIYGENVKAPKLEGDTGIGELGLVFTTPGSSFSLDLGVQGYVGKREGVTGSFQMKWTF